MQRIVCNIKPFAYSQILYAISDNGDKIQTEVPLTDLAEGICAFCEQTEIADVALSGSVKYSEGVKERVEAIQILNYGQNKINIEII